MHNFRLWSYLVFGLIFSGSLQANAIVTPVGVNSASINSSGQVVAMQTFRAQYAGQPDSYYSRAVAYNKATTGKLARARTFVKGNALNIGLVAGTLAIGYFLDQVTKDIYPNAQSLPTASQTCNPHFTVTGYVTDTKGCSTSGLVAQHVKKCDDFMKANAGATSTCTLTTPP